MTGSEDAANSAPTQEPQHSGAAGLVAAHSRTCVELSAADYSLGPLDFGTPVLTRNHVLSAANYLLGPLEFSAPAWRYGYWRIRWIDAGSDVALGRPRDIANSAAPDLIAKMERWLIEKQATTFRRLTREDRAVTDYARKLAAEAGIETSDQTLLRQIIRPAFQNVESRS
jgi:hypothetical protein